MIITLTMNPAVDKTAEIKELQTGSLHRLSNIVLDAGGKGINVSKTIKNLGKDSLALGVLAGNTGMFIESELDRLKVTHDFIKIEGNTRTNLKIVDEKKVLTEFNESGPTPNVEQLQILTDKITSYVNAKDVLVLSGSVPNGMRTTYYGELIAIAKSKGAKVILDADGALFKEGIKQLPTIIKPNRFELLQYFDLKEDCTEAELIAHAQSFLQKGVELVVVSMGKEGSYFLSEEAIYKVDPILVKAHSSVGAGDAMVAALAYGTEEGMKLEELICLSCACASGAVMTTGTKPASKELIEDLKKKVNYTKF